MAKYYLRSRSIASFCQLSILARQYENEFEDIPAFIEVNLRLDVGYTTHNQNEIILYHGQNLTKIT